MQKKEYVREIDILRGLFCVFVLLIHITASPSISLENTTTDGFIYLVLNTITKMAVPGFIFISGFSLFYTYKDREKVNTFKFYLKRFIHVVIPYVLYTLIYYAFYIYKFNYEVSWNFLIEKLLDGSMVYHLYYIIIIIQFYILFPVLFKVFKKVPTDLFLVLATIANLYLANSIASTTLFVKYLMFFSLGAYIGFNYEQIKLSFNKKNIQRIILSLGLIVNVYFVVGTFLNLNKGIELINNTWYIFSFISILFYFILAKYIVESKNILSRFVKNILTDISKVSFSVYLIHPLVLLLLDENIVISNLGEKYFVIGLIMILLTVFYSKICKLIRNIRKMIRNKIRRV